MATAKKAQTFSGLPSAAKGGILVGVLALVLAVYYFAFHMSVADAIDNAKQQHTKLQSDLKKSEKRQQEYLALTEELASREAADRMNKRVLPEEAEIAAFLQDLNRLSELSGLKMRLVEPRPEETQELYVRIPVNLRLSGRYHQIGKFFHNVSRLERAINLENVRLTAPSKKGEEILLQVDVLATTFRRPAAPPAPPPGPKGKPAAGKKAPEKKS